MTVRSRFIERVITCLAGMIVVLLAATVPVGYFLVGWNATNSALRTEAKLYALQISAVINRNPTMWSFEVVRLEGLLRLDPGDEAKEAFRVLDRNGNVVLEQRPGLPGPLMTRAYPLMDAGAVVGSLEISQSVRPLIMNTAALALLSGGMGVGLFFLVRVYPMSALSNALDQLMYEKERAQITLRSIGDGVISTDSEDRIIHVNRIAEKLTGWSQAEAAGLELGEVFRREEGVLVVRDGSRRQIEMNASPIFDESGNSSGAVYVFQDVTEKERIAQELLNAKKLESLGIMAGGIAHEIRNPLSGITISLSALERVCGRSEGLEPEAKEKVRLLLDEMASAAAKMTAVVQRVLEFSRPTPPRLEKVDLNAVVQDAVRLSSSTLRTRGVSLDLGLDPALPACRADRRLIEQVLVNLITNAYQAMEGTDGAKRLEVATAVRDGSIVVRIADSGPGIAGPLQEKIFDPFFTTRKDGTGIGLSFSRRIVDSHGGKLSAEKSRWGGAEFRITLPVAAERIPS